MIEAISCRPFIGEPQIQFGGHKHSLGCYDKPLPIAIWHCCVSHPEDLVKFGAKEKRLTKVFEFKNLEKTIKRHRHKKAKLDKWA